MNICVDVGNTMVKIGFFKDDVLINTVSFTTDEKKTDSEFFALIKQQLEMNNIIIESSNNIIFASVVPTINFALKNALTRLFKGNMISLANGIKTGLKMKVDNPSEVGSDLIADCVGAKNRYGYPTIVCDLGTASKILLVDKDGYFSSCAIIPGIAISAEILSKKGEMLPKVALEAPKKVVARNTIDCMKVGIVYGHAEMITGLVNLLEKEIGYTCKKVLTGGGANYIKDIIRGDFTLDQGICLEGLHDILKRNLI